jgi:hypothetical protein
MADKPRVKVPQQRASTSPDSAARNRRLALIVGGSLAALAAVVAIFALLGTGGGRPSEEAVRTALENAGCSLQAVAAQPAQHSITDPSGTSARWNTDPPTNGPHYAEAAIFGAYPAPLEQARVVHNLEHGGIFIQYGDDVPAAVVDRLRSFYDDHQTGTIMAPLPKLGDQFALGAWVAEGEQGKGYLAKCSTFDEDAVSSFFEGFQFLGPERFDPSQLRPGH